MEKFAQNGFMHFCNHIMKCNEVTKSKCEFGYNASVVRQRTRLPTMQPLNWEDLAGKNNVHMFPSLYKSIYVSTDKSNIPPQVTCEILILITSPSVIF